jgi:histidinol-phosphatase (PHP family)
VEETLEAIAGAGVIMELNTSAKMAGRGDWQPAAWVLRRVLALGIRLVVSSDAHRPENVDRGLDEGSRLLSELGFSHLMELREHGWEELALERAPG